MRILDLKIICPACSAEFKLADGTRENDLLEIARLVTMFGQDWPLIESYLNCFRTRKGLGIKLEKLRVVLEELAFIWQNKTFSLAGKSYPVSALALRKALQTMSARSDEFVGFANHNYLKKVCVNLMRLHQAEQRNLENAQYARDRQRSPAIKSDPMPAGQAAREILGDLKKE